MKAGDWVRIGMNCQHCGLSLEARYAPNRGAIQLATPLAFRHAATQTEQCTPTTTAQPYDGWRAAKAYDQRAREIDE